MLIVGNYTCSTYELNERWKALRQEATLSANKEREIAKKNPQLSANNRSMTVVSFALDRFISSSATGYAQVCSMCACKASARARCVCARGHSNDA